jgi:hypothetical protein
LKTIQLSRDIVVNVNGVLTEAIAKMIKDRVNHIHVFNTVNIYSIKNIYTWELLLSYLGNCINTSITDFICICDPGYEGNQCEKMVDLCANVTCQNGGICARKFLNYTCNCLAFFALISQCAWLSRVTNLYHFLHLFAILTKFSY